MRMLLLTTLAAAIVAGGATAAPSPGLDAQGVAPFGRVTSDMTAIAKLYAGYGEAPPNAQARITAQGEAFLEKRFPKPDRILKARIVR